MKPPLANSLIEEPKATHEKSSASEYMINGHLISPEEIQELEALKSQYFHIKIGGKHKVLSKTINSMGNETLYFESLQEFKNNFLHHPKICKKNKGEAYLLWSGKSYFEGGIGYYPNGIGQPKNTYNTFVNFPIKPLYGDYSLILSHVTDVLCGGDATTSSYVLDYLAHIFQKPNIKPTVAILLKSVEGTGKGTLFKLLKKMLGVNAIQQNGHYQITGRFNSVIAEKLLVFGDEVDFTSRAIFDRLKGIISESEISLEYKGLEPISIRNYARFIFAANHDWTITAGERERRFLILEPSDCKVGDRTYWMDLHKTIEDNGANFFLDYLLKRDITNFDPYNAPVTKALIEEKLRAMSDVQQFLFANLSTQSPSSLRYNSDNPATQIISEYQNWLKSSRGDNVPDAVARSVIGKQFSKMGIKPKGRSDRGRGKLYSIPSANEMQELFAKTLGHTAEEIFY